jgi:5-methylthioadenosine/S-adenosylhomocysteine deaminase
MTNRLLIKGGVVLTQDSVLGDLPGADVLVEEGKILEIGPDLAVSDAQTIDASGMVVIPGFVDTHRHMWQTVLRGILPSCTLNGYFQTTAALGPGYRPEDIYVSNLLGALEALNAGITTVVDWSHNNMTPAHADAGVGALRDAGIRAMYAHGTPAGFEWWFNSALEHPDSRRVREQHFSSDDDLLTFALAARGPGISAPEVTVHDWMLARELDARITVHAGMRVTGSHTQAVVELDKAGLLADDTTYVHATTTTDDELALIKRSGGSVSVAPYVEMLMGHGHPPTARLLEHGIAPTLSIDVVSAGPGDMFTQMRTALTQGRLSAFGEDPDVDFEPTLTHTDVLGFATLAGAQACGLGNRTGSLIPGKDADIVLIRAHDINTIPLVDPAATVVTYADTANVDTVIVRGEIRKRAGKLVGIDLPRLRQEAERSRDYVLEKASMNDLRRVKTVGEGHI